LMPWCRLMAEYDRPTMRNLFVPLVCSPVVIQFARHAP
jgi:hypothetical protein